MKSLSNADVGRGSNQFCSIQENRSADNRYQEALREIPAPGYGCHPFLLSVANRGVSAKIRPEEIFEDIRLAIPCGSRKISDREITNAINKALADYSAGTFTPKPRPVPAVANGTAVLQKIISRGKYSDDADLWEASPIHILDELRHDAILLLSTLYRPEDLLYIGERDQAGIPGETIRTACEWISYYQNGGRVAPHILINPVTGTPAPKKSGDGETYRGDGNVTSYRYCLVEFDMLTREDQIRFWSAIKLPIVALIDTGGKSIHAWLDVKELAGVNTSAQWETEIKSRLFDRILTPLGVDSACSNSGRMSRLPGHFRDEKGNYQRLLWLSPEGRAICR